MKNKSRVWLSAKIEAAEEQRMAEAARALGISKSEFLRRALRVATPVLAAMPTAGVKKVEAVEEARHG